MKLPVPTPKTFAIASFSLLAGITAGYAGAVALWNLEDGIAGQSFTATGNPNGSGGAVEVDNFNSSLRCNRIV